MIIFLLINFIEDKLYFENIYYFDGKLLLSIENYFFNPLNFFVFKCKIKSIRKRKDSLNHIYIKNS